MKWKTAPTQGRKQASCGEIPKYLKVWCIIIGLRGGTEASCTIGQVSYCLLGEGCRDHSNIATGRAAVTYMQGYKLSHIILVHSDKQTLRPALQNVDKRNCQHENMYKLNYNYNYQPFKMTEGSFCF